MGEEDNERFSKYGWDKNALFYPNETYNIVIIAIFFLLFITYFSEIFGFANTNTMILGVMPAHLAYHIFHMLLILIFIYVIYRTWPEEVESY